jgi:hypothetical protein
MPCQGLSWLEAGKRLQSELMLPRSSIKLAGTLEIQFCSTDCLRQFLMASVNELERRMAAVEPQVRAARETEGKGDGES